MAGAPLEYAVIPRNYGVIALFFLLGRTYHVLSAFTSAEQFLRYFLTLLVARLHSVAVCIRAITTNVAMTKAPCGSNSYSPDLVCKPVSR